MRLSVAAQRATPSVSTGATCDAVGEALADSHVAHSDGETGSVEAERRFPTRCTQGWCAVVRPGRSVEAERRLPTRCTQGWCAVVRPGRSVGTERRLPTRCTQGWCAVVRPGRSVGTERRLPTRCTQGWHYADR